MIKYLTEKLKPNTLDEDRTDKVKEIDYDSGTESDDQISNLAMNNDENDHLNGDVGSSLCTRHGTTVAGGNIAHIRIVTPASSPYFLDSALPSDCDLTNDHHSSEEELEVINGGKSVNSEQTTTTPTALSSTSKRVSRSSYGTRCRSVSSMLPEKRKWSDAMDAESPPTHNAVGSNSSSNSNSPTASAATITAKTIGGNERSTPSHRSRLRISIRRHISASDENVLRQRRTSSRCGRKTVNSCSSEASSDEESPNGAFAPISPSTLVNFSRSPPLNAHKPPTIRSLSPPLKMLNCGDDVAASAAIDQSHQQRSLNVSSSPKYKRHRLTPTQRNHHATSIQRPCLDFEKMQQMKENAVTTWRHHNGGEHSGELSLYCW